MTNLMQDFPAAGATGGDAFNVAFFVLVSMFVIVGIAYLIARIMSNRNLEEWSRNEFLQVMVSAALVGGLFMLLAPGSGLIVVMFDNLVSDNALTISVPNLTVVASGNTTIATTTSLEIPIGMNCSDSPVDSGTVLCFAYNYLSFLELQIIGLMAIIFSINFVLDILSKLAIDIIVVQVAPLAGLSSVVQVLNSMLQSLFLLGILAGVEKALLVFVDVAAFQIFLPIGVVLRCFFATRRLGGALIAIAIGLYLIFPLTIAMNAIAVKEVAIVALDPLFELQDAVSKLNVLNHFSSAGDIINPGAWRSFLSSFSGAVSALVVAISKLPSMMTAFISILVVQIVFLPILSIMLTIIAIKELAGLFGAEINLSRFEV